LITSEILDTAARASNSRLIDHLLDQQIDLDITQNLLVQASSWSNTAVIRYLLEQESSLKVDEEILVAAAGNMGTRSCKPPWSK
jgi:hypothetical protein